MGALDSICFASQEDVEANGLEPTRLFVGQIARDANVSSELRGIFEQHGPLQEFHFVHDKGVLYVSYATFEEAQSALQALSNLAVSGVSKGLNVRFSQRRW